MYTETQRYHIALNHITDRGSPAEMLNVLYEMTNIVGTFAMVRVRVPMDLAA